MGLIATAIGPITAIVLATVPGATGHPGETVLDDRPVVDVAVDGDRVAWLRAPEAQPSADRPSVPLELVVRDGDGELPRTISRPLPPGTSGLALGGDARGRATVVLVARGALYALPADGSRPPWRLPVSRGPGAERAPGLWRGRLSFARTTGRGSRSRIQVRRGTLGGTASTVVWDGDVAETGDQLRDATHPWVIGTDVVDDRRVLVHAGYSLSIGDGESLLVAADGAARPVLRTSRGEAGSNRSRILRPVLDRRAGSGQVSTLGVIGPRALFRFSLSAARVVGRRSPPGGWPQALPLASGAFAVSNPTWRDPEADALCLPDADPDGEGPYACGLRLLRPPDERGREGLRGSGAGGPSAGG